MTRTPITAATLHTLTAMLHMRLTPELYESVKKIYGESRAREFLDDLGRGVSALHTAIPALNDGKGYVDPKPGYDDRTYPDLAAWIPHIQDEILKYNSRGAAYITSVSECVTKTLGLINLHQGQNERTTALFRGQIDAAWKLTSSIGRKIPPESIPEDRMSVSQFELNSLKKWQTRVLDSKELQEEVFSNQTPYDKHDPRWWGLKQHYDDDPETGGTRFVDWTSSPLCGLYFSCVDWDGVINEEIDGCFFVLKSKVGRLFASKEYLSRIPKDEHDFYDLSGSSAFDYFNNIRYPEVLRTVITEAESERQLSQDGYFIFAPLFENPITFYFNQNPFFFIIPGDCKKAIARELYSLGYTPKKIVRGRKGICAHEKLRADLGITD